MEDALVGWGLLDRLIHGCLNFLKSRVIIAQDAVDHLTTGINDVSGGILADSVPRSALFLLELHAYGVGNFVLGHPLLHFFGFAFRHDAKNADVLILVGLLKLF